MRTASILPDRQVQPGGWADRRRPDGSVRIAVAGDVGHPSSALDATVATMAAEHHDRPYDGLVLLGDNVYPDGDPGLVDAAVGQPFAPLLRSGVPMHAVLGNHDVERGEGDTVAALLGMPSRWYQRWIGPVQLIALDSTRVEDPRQRAWLGAVLRRPPTAAFRVVALHHPPFSAGWHGSATAVRHSWVPLFRRYGVDLVLAGHEHDYQRSRRISGVTYLVSGAATHLRPTSRRWFTASSCSAHHFLDLVATPERLVVRALDHDRIEIDRTELRARRRRTIAVPSIAPRPLRPVAHA